MNRLSLAPLAFALVALAAPAARAQNTALTVCQDGTTTAVVTSRACVGHGGINVDATRQLRAQRANGTGYGVYDSRGNATNGNQIPCGDGTYSGTIHGCDARGGVATTTTQMRCTDGTYSTGGLHACAAHGGVSTTQNGQYNNGQYNNGQYNNGQYNNGRRNDADDSRNVQTATSRRDRTAVRNGATAKCVDGTYSKAASRRGACVQHGGITAWYGRQR